MIMVSHCKECGEVIDDETWKTLCLSCFLKEKNPEAYQNKFEMKEITCKKCGKVFWSNAWEDRCSPCWLKDLNEKKQEDLREREHYK
jgi:NMD protein affecting ribosome stability and mRNA decay